MAFSALAVRNGHIKRITDQDIQSSVLEIMSSNVSTTYITCPADPTKTLGIKLPFLVMIIKNLKKYFSFEVQVLDDKNVRRRFRASNYQVCAESMSAMTQMAWLSRMDSRLAKAAGVRQLKWCQTGGGGGGGWARHVLPPTMHAQCAMQCRPCGPPFLPCMARQ